MNLIQLHKPDSTVVSLLTDLLAQAQAGDVMSLIYSAEIPGGKIQTGYTAQEDLYSSIGQLERMKYLLLRSIDNNARKLEETE
jgi:hypothetical protein